MIEPLPLPGDPTELRLRIHYTDTLSDTLDADTLEEWSVEILHRSREHASSRCPTAPGACDAADCPAYTVSDSAAGSMTFFRVHLDRGRNAYAAMEEASEDLCEIAQALLDPATGYYTDEVGELLEYSGSALLVMDRVTLHEEWRGRGLGVILASEAIYRLMPGCRAVACAPGISDMSANRLRSEVEWGRVTAKIARGWEQLGFLPCRGNVFVLSPTSLVLEEQRGQLRRRLVELGAAWAAARA
ncbi:hypothetical protein DMA15_30420 [Streptomyces sp. WAC 01529]|uniref:hypothetical protein n=1 Tax=unclassified Streptomyces TaxID=2593676 RepID=UPI000F709863|nr:hypothetical protein [Streptomyces sp. WAC 01529]AZM56367.1 hypothetical protein DMA15_30420 [Streptomyces sp. WAC 01529]